jgi:hypothetical protein
VSALLPVIANALWSVVSFGNFEIPRDVIHLIATGSASI